jgi:hypothetical protein
MASKIETALRATLAGRIRDALARPANTPGGANAETIAARVADEVTPLVTNANNGEPWYRSRIYLGLLVTALGFITSRWGFTVSAGDLDTIIVSAGSLMEAGGALFALYGRVVGNRKPPLGK